MLSLLLVAAIATASPAPTPTASADPHTWLGVHLGESRADVYATFGEAGMSILSGRAYNFSTDHARGQIGIEFRDNLVSTITLTKDYQFAGNPTVKTPETADPFGATLTMSKDELRQLRGAPTNEQSLMNNTMIVDIYKLDDDAAWRYMFAFGKFSTMSLQATQDYIGAMQKGADVTLHGGTSTADAIPNLAADELSGIRNEHLYTATLTCAGGAHYTWANQALRHVAGKSFDIISLKCAQSDEMKDVYFDISSFFGKM